MSDAKQDPPSNFLLWGFGLFFVAGLVYAIVLAVGYEVAYDSLVLFLYGGIGFFGALGLMYFLGGFIVYLVRLGQEYRQEGLYHMLHGVRILFYVLCAVLILKLIE